MTVATANTSDPTPMTIFWFFSSLVYFLTCLLLAGYSLLGLCIRPLAATESYAAGNLLLIYLLLLTASISGVCYLPLLGYVLFRRGWQIVTSGADLLMFAETLVMLLLPFYLCRRACRRPAPAFLIAVVSFIVQVHLFFEAASGA